MNELKVKIGALYGRVSVDDAAEVEHGSLEQQEHMGKELIRDLSNRTGTEHVLKHVLIEERGVSGGNTDRPKYQRLLDLIRSRKIDFLVAKEISRLSRSLQDFCELMELCKANNVAVHIRGVDADPTSPMGELIFKLLAMIAEFERKMIMQRTRDSTRSAMLNNAKINGGLIAFGFRKIPGRNGYWEPVPEEMKKVELLMRTYLEMASIKATIDESKRLGIKTKSGRDFTPTTLKSLLKNTKYVGKMKVVHGEKNEKVTWVNLPHGRVLPTGLFEDVQEALAKATTAKKNQNRQGTRIYALTGLLYHHDGSHYRGYSGTSRDGSRHFYYRNTKHGISLAAEELETKVAQYLKQSYASNSELQRTFDELKVELTSKQDLLRSQVSTRKGDLRKLETEESNLLNGLTNARGGSHRTIQWLDDQVENLHRKKTEIQASLEELERDLVRMSDCTPTEEGLKTRLSKAFKNLDGLAPKKKRGFLRSVLDRIEILEGNQIEIRWSIPQESGFEGEKKAVGKNVFPTAKWLAR